MSCKPDNKKIFEEEVVYSAKCEACGYFAKFQHYRQCQDRFKWNEEHGNDIMAPVKEANRIAQSQTGQKIKPVDGVDPLDSPNSSSSSSDKKTSKPQRHRRGK